MNIRQLLTLSLTVAGTWACSTDSIDSTASSLQSTFGSGTSSGSVRPSAAQDNLLALPETLMALVNPSQGIAGGFKEITPKVTEFVINSSVISESSGIARSHHSNDIFWTFNDSGGDILLYAITDNGSHIASLSINGVGVANLDWEDITSFERDGKKYLMVGDVGDNNAFRPFTTYYLIEEPQIDRKLAGVQNLFANVVAQYHVVFPDGPRDVEGIAADPATNTVYLISKRDARPTLYSFSMQLPLPLGAPLGLTVPIVLTKMKPINIPRASDIAGFKGNPEQANWVTAMDFSSTGNTAYVGTLKYGYIYKRAAGQTWEQAFQTVPYQFKLPAYSQIEAGCFRKGSDDVVYVTSEGFPGPLARIEFKLD